MCHTDKTHKIFNVSRSLFTDMEKAYDIVLADTDPDMEIGRNDC